MKEKLNSQTWKTLNKNNAYFSFLEECKNTQYPAETVLHYHHIIPKYVFGKKPSPEDANFIDSLENIVCLSVVDHVKAHQLLFEIYGNPQDEGATLMLSGYESESRLIWRKLGAATTNKLMKDQKKTFWAGV
jgi:hypothetical protein